MTELAILLLTAAGGILFGMWFRRREGKIRPVAAAPAAPAAPAAGAEVHTVRGPAATLAAVGVGHVPTVLHFSADWCGPCAAVRRVIGQVVQDLGPDYGDVIEIELDLDQNPALAKELGVMSLPTTFIYDSAGAQRFRIAGVPKAAELQQALAGL